MEATDGASQAQAVDGAGCCGCGRGAGGARGDETWNSTVSAGDWNVAGNWIPNGVPASTDNVFITASDATDRTVTLNTTSTIGGLTIGNGGSGTHTLVQAAAFDLTSATESLGTNTAGVGVHLQSTGTNNTQQLDLGDDSNGIGFYTLSGSSTLAVAHEEYLYNGTFTQLGGTHTIDNLYVGAGASPAGYELQSGTLMVNTDENIGDTGAFDQTGGTHTIGQSLIAATYTLTGSSVLSVTGDSGVFDFVHSGGTHSVGGTLSIVTSYSLGGAASLHVSGDEDLGVIAGDPATFTQSGGSHQVDGTLSVASVSGVVANYSLSSGTLSANAIQIAGGGTLTQSGGTLSTSSVQLTGGGRMIVAASGDRTLYADTLNVDSSSALDLNDNGLVVNNGVFSTIRQMVFDGYSNAPSTSATGIISTTSQNAGGNTILLLFDNAQVGVTDWPPGSGHSVGANAIIGRYTYFGDTNLDGQVTGDDYSAIDANLGTTGLDPGVAILYGDTNFDNQITGDDYSAVDANLGLGVGHPLAVNALPEPAGGMMVMMFAGAG